jgi:hypothetical protein
VGDAGMKLTISDFDLFGILVRLVRAPKKEKMKSVGQSLP